MKEANMTLTKTLCASIAALALFACGPSVLTDIRANGDGTYTITRVKGGGRVHGEVYHCTPPSPAEMVCDSIDNL
jgi:hypothetical protein